MSIPKCKYATGSGGITGGEFICSIDESPYCTKCYYNPENCPTLKKRVQNEKK